MNINIQDENGYTPLIFSILNRDKAKAFDLILKNADPNIRDIDNETALSLALQIKKMATLEI